MSAGLRQARRARRETSSQSRLHTGKPMSVAALMEWELGARVTGDLLGENDGPYNEAVVLQRLTRAWPYSRLVGQVIRLNVRDDNELYHVKEYQNGELLCDQLTYPVTDWPKDGDLLEWLIDPSQVAEAIEWKEME